ncbi:TRAP transporter substrate-binding protein [Selenomonas ruminantium]|uniref:Tripartite ATP-independent transporter solute receptor, DctP family n=1 Tax=Selenomonas ruminantium TaxID=971 RepID=A0A1H0TUT1_SELRU|nr:TRAP transporter substrate-binding protein [Selenomonas ruminantium]SDP57704.1 tripartite ATP-independent transporter solute receptor, DctP family [Selenomonas ruminantium]
MGWKSKLSLLLLVGLICFLIIPAGNTIGNGKRIVRIAHSQSEKHPEHIGLLAFKKHVEEKLGDKFEVQIFPNELLGGQKKAIELTQTGAIDFIVVGCPNVETIASVYEVFSMPYLFASQKAYFDTMRDEEYMKKIYTSTDEAGFRVMTWYNAGIRSFYAKEKIEKPEDMQGMKLRVQQSPASIAMVNAFGAAATPMAFGEVYTAIQQGVIDGAENNELAITNNKHGEVAKYYSYTNHQMIPDVLMANLRFLQSLSPEEQEVFAEAARLSTDVELEAWDKEVENAKKIAQEEMGVTFVNVDMTPFRAQVLELHKEMLAKNPNIRDIYEHIQTINARDTGAKE